MPPKNPNLAAPLLDGLLKEVEETAATNTNNEEGYQRVTFRPMIGGASDEHDLDAGRASSESTPTSTNSASNKNDNNSKNKNRNDDDDGEAEESMIDLLSKVRMKAQKVQEEGERLPSSVEEAEKMEQDLEKRKQEQKKHLVMLNDIDVNEKNRAAYKEAASAIASAYDSVKKGVERSRTVIQMSRFVLPEREAKRLQICFCFDATGSLSMGNIIGVFKDTMIDIVRKVQESSSLPVEAGFVCYRDYDDKHRFERCSFTSNVEKIVDKLSKIKPNGGGDDAEDCLGAIEYVIDKMNWAPVEQSIRVCCWCGDAPGHGLLGNSPHPADFKDDFPRGDKFGLTVPKIVSELIENHIVLCFLRVNATTDHMIALFRAEFLSQNAQTHDLPMVDLADAANTRALVDDLLVRCSAVATTTRRRKVGGANYNNNENNTSNSDSKERAAELGDKKLDPTQLVVDPITIPPKRDVRDDENTNIPRATLRGTLFAVTPIQFTDGGFVNAKRDINKFIKEVLAARTFQELPPAKSVMTSQAVLSVEVPYFATGGSKFAHLAGLSSNSLVSSSSSTRVIAKDLVNRIDYQSPEILMQKHLEDLKSICISQALASVFCDTLKIPQSAIEFLHRSIFVVEKDSSNQKELSTHPSISAVYSIEPLLDSLLGNEEAAPTSSSVSSSTTTTAARMSRLEKYNSNGGFVNPRFELMQAFSHFTWHITDGAMMILDLVGCHEERDKRFFRLLLPAIQTKDLAMCPSLKNIGLNAMADFLKVHLCAGTCRACRIPALVVGGALPSFVRDFAGEDDEATTAGPNFARRAKENQIGGGNISSSSNCVVSGDGGLRVLTGPPVGYSGGASSPPLRNPGRPGGGGSGMDRAGFKFQPIPGAAVAAGSVVPPQERNISNSNSDQAATNHNNNNNNNSLYPPPIYTNGTILPQGHHENFVNLHDIPVAEFVPSFYTNPTDRIQLPNNNNNSNDVGRIYAASIVAPNSYLVANNNNNANGGGLTSAPPFPPSVPRGYNSM